MMARVFPFQPYRYSPSAGELSNLVTQPYDKISPEMQARYLAANPYNLVRIILGPRAAGDNDQDNVYTRAAAYLRDWTQAGVIAREPAEAIFAYFQTFDDPETAERVVRKGFIALGALEPYEANVVHRHELTLSGPKRDRMELLRATRAHFGQVFMLYSDPERTVDQLLDEAASAPPIAQTTDEYGVVHQLWRITGAARIAQIQRAMAPQKLVIADGHHRYETALAFRDESGVDRLMMTFVNTHSPGLRILATHRVATRLPGYDTEKMLVALGAHGDVERMPSDEMVKQRLAALHHGASGAIAIGLAAPGASALIHAPAGTAGFDVDYLHGTLLPALGIHPDAVRDEKFLEYVRGIDNAIAMVRNQGAPAAFLLTPTPTDRVMAHSLAGGVMPQKATDFYPKLLSGLTIWKIDE